MAMTPLERKAAFKAAVTLREMTMAEAAQSLRVSYNHLMLVLAGHRVGSLRLEHDVAAFVRMDRDELFPRDAREVVRTAQPSTRGRPRSVRGSDAEPLRLTDPPRTRDASAFSGATDVAPTAPISTASSTAPVATPTAAPTVTPAATRSTLDYLPTPITLA
jgi:hypothetical protein